MPVLRELLAQVVELGASDLHLKTNQRPTIRLHADLVQIGEETLSLDDVALMANSIMPIHLRERFSEDHEVDFSLSEEGVGRFRVNTFYSNGFPTIAMRHVKTAIPDFEGLHLPLILKDLALVRSGIILAAGTTGSGKSTTLAALLQHINRNLKRRIITIEDPIEYVFEDNQSVISQREVGLDTPTFRSALRHVLRQDPDIIMIGEMRDSESFMAALSAAETGHLIFSTLHTGDASQSIQRILDFFPSAEHEQIRMSLMNTLRGVICQRLVPGINVGVVPAVELLINTPTVRKLLEKNLLEKLPAAIETGTADGMQTFDQAIYSLIKSGTITEEEGMARCTNAEALKMNLKGIFLDESRRILST